MDSKFLRSLLENVRNGRLDLDAAMHQLKKFPFEDLGYARIDNHRAVRKGVSEVIFCAGKTVSQVVGIAQRMSEQHRNVLFTRATKEVYDAVRQVVGNCEYHETARIIVVNREMTEQVGNVVLVSAGTSDMPVAEEAAVTAEVLGNRVNRIYDVGVAGIHRLFHVCDELFVANVAVVVAGMEGALASVVGGLVSCPVIGVPTSIGYGTSFGGLAALLSMLNSCAPGVAVVNIDNGFGAGYQASLINQAVCGKDSGPQPIS